MSSLKTLAIITARGGSKGIPLKNIKLLNGVPMISYTIEAALKCHCIDEVLVSTDHDEIACISQTAGALVPFIRPKELSTDHAKSIDVVAHAIEYYERINSCSIDHIILLQPTSPLRTAEDIDAAWRVYLEMSADSLQSVVEVNDHPYYLRKVKDGLLINYDSNDYKENLRRQDLDKIFRVNGAIYIARRDLIMNKKTFVGEKNAAYIMSKEKSVDVDDNLDFSLAELIVHNNS
ncbi:acylneuraminate cytidylyltransferase family protein [Paenibacillus bouchesdurhonensis]|uniref:acylneuraminate cytidylyltransferase family protein n=1 Tax=Paenibacillus bouchesdurhonensis TaxID=1870990 RepID=UPI000DA62155|nr:acylneuraminate cytidylyltransferase family protein [Paenibacillus bouchesdurhonensis]